MSIVRVQVNAAQDASLVTPPPALARAWKYDREAKSRPSTSDPWDLISEKLCIEVNGERKRIFRSRLNSARNYTYVRCLSILKNNFHIKKVTVCCKTAEI